MYPTLTSLKLKLMTILRMHLILARCERRMFSELRENFIKDDVTTEHVFPEATSHEHM